MGNKTGTNTSSMWLSARAKRNIIAYNKRFNKRYKAECSECITRIATKEELNKYFK